MHPVQPIGLEVGAAVRKIRNLESEHHFIESKELSLLGEKLNHLKRCSGRSSDCIPWTEQSNLAN
jgi:hypothetical protein